MQGRIDGMRRGSWADKYRHFGENRFLRNADTNMYGAIFLGTAIVIFINVHIKGLTWRQCDEMWSIFQEKKKLEKISKNMHCAQNVNLTPSKQRRHRGRVEVHSTHS